MAFDQYDNLVTPTPNNFRLWCLVTAAPPMGMMKNRKYLQNTIPITITRADLASFVLFFFAPTSAPLITAA